VTPERKYTTSEPLSHKLAAHRSAADSVDSLKAAPHYLEVGCRIPKDYFWVIGWGESEVGIETGSYDAALTMAGIENFNVMLYTSVLPPEACELPHLPNIHHGSVMEAILAAQHTDRAGTPITAGLLLAKVFRKSGPYFGGFACEYAGGGTLDEARSNLGPAMEELFSRRYPPALIAWSVGRPSSGRLRRRSPLERFSWASRSQVTFHQFCGPMCR
jgi:arginine decarboxylase